MKIKEWLRVIFISPEFMLLLGVTVWSRVDWQSLTFLGKVIREDGDVVKWLPVLPGALCAYSASLALQLTTPVAKSSIELLEWPGYWRLQMRRNLCLILAFLSAASAILIWIFSKHVTDFWLGAWTVATFGVSVVNCATMYFASITLKEIMEQ